MNLRDIRYWPHNIKYGLQNLWDYFPLIWRDRDYDWEYLAKLMEFKINRIADHIGKYGHHVCAAEDVKEMRLCVLLLRRIIADDYPIQQGVRLPDGMMKQDETLLFETMRKHWRKWWD